MRLGRRSRGRESSLAPLVWMRDVLAPNLSGAPGGGPGFGCRRRSHLRDGAGLEVGLSARPEAAGHHGHKVEKPVLE